MANRRLTEKRIRDAKHDPNRITFLWDAGLPGFGVRLSKTGVQAFVLWTRSGGKKRLLTLGRWPDLSLEGARKAAALELDAIESGKADLLTRRSARRNAMTVADGCQWFLETYIPRRKGLRKMADRTATEYRRQIARFIVPSIGHLKIEAVQRQDVEAMLDQIGFDKPAQFTRVRSLVRSLFNIFEAEGWRAEGTNPGRRIATPTERERTRTLTPDEQAAFLAALAWLGDTPATLAIIFLYQTGCRLSEARTLRWEFVNPETQTVHLPETKTGSKTIRATDEAMEIVARSPMIHGNPFVFAGGRGAALSEKTIRRTFNKAADFAGLENIKPHDLRRSFITDAIGVGVALTTVADLVGHATIAMTARYAKAGDSKIREAGEQLAAARKAQRGADIVAPKFGETRA